MRCYLIQIYVTSSTMSCKFNLFQYFPFFIFVKERYRKYYLLWEVDPLRLVLGRVELHMYQLRLRFPHPEVLLEDDCRFGVAFIRRHLHPFHLARQESSHDWQNVKDFVFLWRSKHTEFYCLISWWIIIIAISFILMESQAINVRTELFD